MQIPKISFKSLLVGFLSGFICFGVFIFIYAALPSKFHFSHTAGPLPVFICAFLAFIVMAYVTVSIDLHVMTRRKKILVSIGVLIGVVMGGMLSYAVTQSGRGAGETPVTPLITAAQTTEQPADVRAAVHRMTLTGALPENITFTGAATSNDVFDQEHGGGGATDIPPPTRACSPHCKQWTYLAATNKDNGWYVHGVGTSATDAIAYLPNITPEVCRALQKGLGFASSIPPKQARASFDPAKPGVYSATGSATTIKSEDGTLDGQSFGCFDNQGGFSGDSSFSYYGVLLEQ